VPEATFAEHLRACVAEAISEYRALAPEVDKGQRRLRVVANCIVVLSEQCDYEVPPDILADLDKRRGAVRKLIRKQASKDTTR
jgi:hypothetical protein